MKIHASTLLLPLLAAGCNAIPSLSVTPRYGPLDVEGDVFVSSVGTSASSSMDALGLDSEDVFSPRADFSWGPADIMVSNFDAGYAGTGMAEGQLDLGTVVINAGDPVRTDLDLSVLTALATFDFIPTKLVDIGIGFGISVVDFDAQIESIGTGEIVGSDENFPIPVLAARVGSQIGPVDVNAHVNGIAGKYDNVEATYVDFDVEGSYSFEEFLGFYAALVVGYRSIVFEVEYDDQGSDIDTDLEFSGFYLGLTAGI